MTFPSLFLAASIVLAGFVTSPVQAEPSRHRPASPAQIDAAVRGAMQGTGARGIAIAVIENGQVRYVQAYGARNAAGAPLTTDTIMYGASITKTLMA